MKYLSKKLSAQKDFILIILVFSFGSFLLGYDYAGTQAIDPAITKMSSSNVDKKDIIADIKKARSMFNFVFSDVMLDKIQQEIPNNSMLETALYSVPFFWEDLQKNHKHKIADINNQHNQLFYNFYEPFSALELKDYLLVHQSPYFVPINKRFGREMLDVSNNEYTYLKAEIDEDMHRFLIEYLKTSLPKEKIRTKL